jgi:hypothetical protein
MRTLTVEGERTKVDPIWLNTVKEDIKRVFHDRRNVEMLRYTRATDVEFILSMALLVKEVSDRMRVIQDCMFYVYIYGGPHISRNKELAMEARAELRGVKR